MNVEIMNTEYAQHAPCMKNTIASRHDAIRQESEDFVRNNLSIYIGSIRDDGQMPTEVVNELAKKRWFGLLIPEEFGGMGMDCLARVLNVEYVTRGCPDVGAVLQIGQLGTGSILEYGSNKQKEKWLPQLSSGERICTIAITEESS